VIQAFKKLSKGLNGLADSSENFKSKTVLGLLRTAPDLKPHIEHVKEMYLPLESGVILCCSCEWY
jgi:DNA mismatch repair protein MSH6